MHVAAEAGASAAALQIPPESAAWRVRNKAAAAALVVTMIGLWIYYR
jgi:hypothetical protein